MVLSGLGLVADGYNIMAINLIRPNLEVEFGRLTAAEDSAVSGASLAGAIVGQLAFGLIADRYGRRLVFVSTAMLICVFSGLSAVARPDFLGLSLYSWLIVFRFFVGMGIGGEYPLSAASTAENVTPRNSSRALATVFAGMAFGLVLGPAVVLLLNEGLALRNALVWRWSFGFGGIAAGVVAVFRYRHLQETASFSRSAASVPAGRAGPSKQGAEGSAKALWSMRWSLAGTAGSWFLYDIVTYGVGLFSTLIFPTAPGYETAVTTLKINAISMLGTFVAIALAPLVQMKALQIYGSCIMGLCFLILMTYSPELGTQSGAHSVFALLVFGLMRAADSAGPGMTTFTIPGEIFPTRLRGTAHGISAASGKLGAVVGVIIFPLMVENTSMKFVMGTMSFVCALTAMWTWVFVPGYGVAHLEMIAAHNNDETSLEQQAMVAERLLFVDASQAHSGKLELVGGLPFAAENLKYS